MESHTTALPSLLTSAEVAEVIRVTEQALRLMRSRGDGPAFIKLPTGSVRYRVEDVEAWIEGSK